MKSLRDYEDTFAFVEENTEKNADSTYHRERERALYFLRELVDYRTPTDVIKEKFDFSDGDSYTYKKCPRCKEMIIGKPHFCENCGQAITKESYEDNQ